MHITTDRDMDHKLLLNVAFICLCIFTYNALFVKSCAMEPLRAAQIKAEEATAKTECWRQFDTICPPQKTKCAAGLVSISTEILGNTLEGLKCVLISEFDANTSYPCQQIEDLDFRCGDFTIRHRFGEYAAFDCHMDATLDYPRRDCSFNLGDCMRPRIPSCDHVTRFLDSGDVKDCSTEYEECMAMKLGLFLLFLLCLPITFTLFF